MLKKDFLKGCENTLNHVSRSVDLFVVFVCGWLAFSGLKKISVLINGQLKPQGFIMNFDFMLRIMFSPKIS